MRESRHQGPQPPERNEAPGFRAGLGSIPTRLPAGAHDGTDGIGAETAAYTVRSEGRSFPFPHLKMPGRGFAPVPRTRRQAPLLGYTFAPGALAALDGPGLPDGGSPQICEA